MHRSQYYNFLNAELLVSTICIKYRKAFYVPTYLMPIYNIRATIFIILAIVTMIS